MSLTLPVRTTLKSRALLLAAPALLALFCAATLHAGEEKTLSERVQFSGTEEIHVEFPVGSLIVETGTGNELVATVEVRCKSSRCGGRVDDIVLDIDQNDHRVSLDIEGYPKWGASKLKVDATIRVPMGHPLYIEMGVGELEIEGLPGDIDVELGVGEIDLRLPEASLRSIELSAGVGDASIRGASGRSQSSRSHLVGSEVEWHDGSGDARVTAEVGVGEVTVRLAD